MRNLATKTGVLNDLNRLAGEHAADKRLELLHRVTDLFMTLSEAPNSAEEFLFAEIIEKLMADVIPQDRAAFVQKIAPSARTPVQLARKLAADEDIEVAGPMLSGSPVLAESDILAIAAKAGGEHLKAIATRSAISTRVTDVLISRGTSEVFRAVSANPGAVISARGMRTLVSRARHDAALGAALVERGDLTQEAVDRLAEVVSESLALRLAEKGFDVGGAVQAGLVAEAQKKLRAAVLTRQTEIEGTSRLAKAVEDGELTLDAALATLVADERLLDVAHLLAHFLKLDRNLVFHTVVTAEASTVMMMFRAVDLAFETLQGVMALRARKRREQPAAGDLDAATYAAIDMLAAQRAIRFLKVRLTTKK